MTAPPTTTVAVPPSTAAVYYATCSQVPAGKKPLRATDPGYRTELDRDGDGDACEP